MTGFLLQGLPATRSLRSGRAAPCAGLRRLLWPVVALLAPVACAQPPDTLAPTAVTAITLEHGCFGCAGTTVLVLQLDGRATLSTNASARHGTAGSSQTGSVDRADFQALARQALAQGFYDLPDRIDNPQQRDGAWTVVRLTRPGHDKQVYWREGVAAPVLASLTRAIEAVRQRIDFAPSR